MEEEDLASESDFARKIDMKELKEREGELFERVEDQGFTSGKVLILAPFKMNAVKVVRDILYMCNGGSWKGVSRRKKFKEEFKEEEQESDCFRLGIKFTAKGGIRLYENYTKCDLIIASPLGLRTGSAKTEETVDYDLLSSIEILLVYGMEALEFQNLEIVEEVLHHCNQIPKSHSSFNDINRIMPLFIEDEGLKRRQMIMLSEFRSLD